ncbi:MAG: hypothetical protein AB1472_04190 [Candidatus Omnitrophota bacterium]
MLKRKDKKIRGSFFLEYTILIAIVAAALLAMQVYFKRSICGKWHEAADVFGFGRQYEPGKTTITNY